MNALKEPHFKLLSSYRQSVVISSSKFTSTLRIYKRIYIFKPAIEESEIVHRSYRPQYLQIPGLIVCQYKRFISLIMNAYINYFQKKKKKQSSLSETEALAAFPNCHE